MALSTNLIIVIPAVVLFLFLNLAARELFLKLHEVKKKAEREKALAESLRLDFTCESKTLKRVEVKDPADKANTLVSSYVQRLIRSNTGFIDMMGESGVNELKAKMKQPHFAIPIGIAKAQLRNIQDYDVFNSFPWWLDRVAEVHPHIYNVITKEPNGPRWFAQILSQCTNSLKGA